MSHRVLPPFSYPSASSCGGFEAYERRYHPYLRTMRITAWCLPLFGAAMAGIMLYADATAPDRARAAQALRTELRLEEARAEAEAIRIVAAARAAATDLAP